MYKLIIVDDEYTIRKGLKHYVPWEKLGFEILGTFEDGLSAISFLSKNPVDVILTDISMPIISGIDLIKKSIENNYASHFVVISGYQDFDFARKLISLHIDDYIMKPIDNSEITNIFIKIKDKLDNSQTEKKRKEKAKNDMHNMQSALRREMFISLFEEKSSIKSIQNFLGDFDLGIDEYSDNIIFSQLHIDNLQSMLSKSSDYKSETIYTIVSDYFINSEKLITDYSKDESNICLISVKKNNNNLNYNLTNERIFITDTIKSIMNTSGICLSLISIKGYQNVISIPEITAKEHSTEIKVKPLEKISHDLFADIYTDINSAVLQNDTQLINEKLNLLYKESSKLTLDKAKIIYHNLFSIFSDHLKNTDIPDISFFEDISKLNSLNDIKKYAQQYIVKICELLSDSSDNQLNSIMDEALLYIDNNFNKDISRNDVADHIYLSASYFSRCFKHRTGLKFIDYLTKIRIEKACGLLMDRKYKISDVCTSVGYNSASYFTRVFKYTIGITPNEYIRQNITKNSFKKARL